MLATDAQGDEELLAAGGMRHLADLLYLVSLPAEFPRERPAAEFVLHPYSEAEHGRFAAVLKRTYAGSLDCPAIEGLRTLDDTLNGYRASGPFDPARWLVASQQDQDVGCLLLADVPAQNQWEVTYIGVVPEARGRGLGLALTRQAQWMTRQARRSRLVLAVDAANEPALKAYEAAGFIHWDRRRVFLRAL